MVKVHTGEDQAPRVVCRENKRERPSEDSLSHAGYLASLIRRVNAFQKQC